MTERKFCFLDFRKFGWKAFSKVRSFRNLWTHFYTRKFSFLLEIKHDFYLRLYCYKISYFTFHVQLQRITKFLFDLKRDKKKYFLLCLCVDTIFSVRKKWINSWIWYRLLQRFNDTPLEFNSEFYWFSLKITLKQNKRLFSIQVVEKSLFC